MEFDYIIVGAGSSGCVLADKLSRDGKNRVLLLEAGSENKTPLIDIPRGWAKLWEDPRYFWSFPIEPQPGRPAAERWAYGKGLGGSSAVNGTMYFRGQPSDYDEWQRRGSADWNWRHMERIFRELEDFHGADPDPSRGRGGPVEITELKNNSPIILSVIKAANGAGFRFNGDLNGARRDGIGFTQTTVDRRGRRVSAYSAFLRDARKRSNLTVETGATVQRVLFDERRASGVEYVKESQRKEYRACNDVIVCAGVMNSPKLLQLSGIGPRGVLERHGVPLVQDLPAVGSNLAEHIMLSFVYRLRNAPGHNREFFGWRLARNVLQYYLWGTGIMAFATTELSAFFSLADNPAWPDAQLCISPYSLTAVPGAKKEPGRGVPERTPGITVTGMILHPKSRGRIEMRSRDANDPPIVYANWLAESSDRDGVVTLVRAIRGLLRRPELHDYVGEEVFPCEPSDSSDEKILKSAMLNLSSGLHGTGTCRMGQMGNSVVDSRLRVHGVGGLRVVDCSVMPTPISGNTNGPAMAVAARAAELILEDESSRQPALDYAAG
jgi:choline dehydrogenase